MSLPHRIHLLASGTQTDGRAVAQSQTVAGGSSAASDLVMPDVMKIGGVTGWLDAVSLAEWAPGLQAPLQVENGQVVFDASMVGSGVEWDAAAVERFRT